MNGDLQTIATIATPAGLGILIFLFLQGLRDLRKEQAARDESADEARAVLMAAQAARELVTQGWLAAIHSRLGTMGASSVPPPIPDEIPAVDTQSYRRSRTPPAGVKKP